MSAWMVGNVEAPEKANMIELNAERKSAKEYSVFFLCVFNHPSKSNDSNNFTTGICQNMNLSGEKFVKRFDISQLIDLEFPQMDLLLR